MRYADLVNKMESLRWSYPVDPFKVMESEGITYKETDLDQSIRGVLVRSEGKTGILLNNTLEDKTLDAMCLLVYYYILPNKFYVSMVGKYDHDVLQYSKLVLCR